jgi:hypothetical protein
VAALTTELTSPLSSYIGVTELERVGRAREAHRRLASLAYLGFLAPLAHSAKLVSGREIHTYPWRQVSNLPIAAEEESASWKLAATM